MTVSRRGVVAAALFSFALAACQDANSVAMKVGGPPDGAVKLRVMETRRYDSTNHASMLSAATQTLQDLGYTISESSSEAGVLSASKQRDAEEAGQVAGTIALSLALALLGSYHRPVWDKDQTISVTLVVSPVADSGQSDVRVNFGRKVVNTDGIWRAELIDDPEIYRQFFEKLSAGLFLEGKGI